MSKCTNIIKERTNFVTWYRTFRNDGVKPGRKFNKSDGKVDGTGNFRPDINLA